MLQEWKCNVRPLTPFPLVVWIAWVSTDDFLACRSEDDRVLLCARRVSKDKRERANARIEQSESLANLPTADKLEQRRSPLDVGAAQRRVSLYQRG
jgi:hypothetical protein